jgi:hypothetical protein
MKKSKIIQMSLASFAALSLSPVGGVAMAQGDHHHRHHDSYACYEVDIENENDIELESTVVQEGSSGDVKVKDNTTVGDVSSGASNNTQTNTIDIDLDNSAPADNLPDPIVHANNNHHNGYKMNIDINNENKIELSNTITQTATSGDVKVEDNTTVGDVTSGSATNTSTNTITITTN